ncbi:hypothetical protein D8770_21660 [Methylobacterium sp. DB1607]|nr:hypothetical protein [Methylobacterium sp. DB1607]
MDVPQAPRRTGPGRRRAVGDHLVQEGQHPMTAQRCLTCGKTAVTERVEPFSVERAGKSLSFDDRRMVCAACGNVSYEGAQISAHELAFAGAVRELEGLLSAADLCAIRSKYRLRQTDMEQMLSTGPKTWTRWERGKVPQSKAADKFIRAIAADPFLARRLMRDAGIVNPEAEEVFARIESDERRLNRARVKDALGARAGLDGDRLVELAADAAFEAAHQARDRAEAIAA